MIAERRSDDSVFQPDILFLMFTFTGSYVPQSLISLKEISDITANFNCIKFRLMRLFVEIKIISDSIPVYLRIYFFFKSKFFFFFERD